MNKYTIIGAFIVVAALAVVLAFYNKNASTKNITTPNSFSEPSSLPLASTQASPASTQIESQTAPLIDAETRGQITCNYLTPPAPNQYGSANIESNWNSASVSICVSANGGTGTLISKDDRPSGSRIDSVNWISLNSKYEFFLYHMHSGDPGCSGTVLSSCQISTTK